MEKQNMPLGLTLGLNRANTDRFTAETLSCIVQLWRTQRKNLNQSLQDSFYAGLSQIPDLPAQQHLEPLCERLMDYISAGHFEVYEKLLCPNKILNSDEVELIKNIYHNIENSTDQALKFNDKYNYDDQQLPNEAALPNDLQKLTKALTIRYVLEEQLVELLRV